MRESIRQWPMHRDHLFSKEIKLLSALWEGVVLTQGQSRSEREGDEVIYQGGGSWRDVWNLYRGIRCSRVRHSSAGNGRMVRILGSGTLEV